MKRAITQRQLRNDSGAVLRAVQAGTSVIVTRNGEPVAELKPVSRRTFVPRQVIADATAGATRIDYVRFRAELDQVADQSIAATAVANGLPVYTRNPSDFAGLDHLVRVIEV